MWLITDVSCWKTLEMLEGTLRFVSSVIMCQSWNEREIKVLDVVVQNIRVKNMQFIFNSL